MLTAKVDLNANIDDSDEIPVVVVDERHKERNVVLEECISMLPGHSLNQPLVVVTIGEKLMLRVV